MNGNTSSTNSARAHSPDDARSLIDSPRKNKHGCRCAFMQKIWPARPAPHGEMETITTACPEMRLAGSAREKPSLQGRLKLTWSRLSTALHRFYMAHGGPNRLAQTANGLPGCADGSHMGVELSAILRTFTSALAAGRLPLTSWC